MRKSLKAILARAARRVGFEVLPTWGLSKRVHADHLASLLSRTHANVVLDVGANRGQFRDFLRSDVGYTGRVISFEPMSSLAQTLMARSSTDPTWSVHQVALGATEGAAILNIMQSDDFSSLRAPITCHTEVWKEENAVRATEGVRVVRLDSLIDELGLDADDQRIFLKLDTQGYDQEVLKGASHVLNRVVALQTELAVLPIYEGAPLMGNMLAYCSELGFDVTGLFPVTRDHFLRVIEFDCVMLNRKVAVSER